MQKRGSSTHHLMIRLSNNLQNKSLSKKKLIGIELFFILYLQKTLFYLNIHNKNDKDLKNSDLMKYLNLV